VARIYISATYGDLKEHRDRVYHALRQLGHDAIAMEDYVAADQRPLAKCLEDVATCYLYVGIFAHRYGHVSNHDNPERRSITELEYRHAEALGFPLLVFLLEELGRERLVSFFATADELARQVSVAVTGLVPMPGS
jgi:hypothetical protein